MLPLAFLQGGDLIRGGGSGQGGPAEGTGPAVDRIGIGEAQEALGGIHVRVSAGDVPAV